MSRGKVAVLAGGFSSEREVSLQSGQAVAAALSRCGWEVLFFDPAHRPLAQLADEGVKAAFNLLHGSFGEDGVVQGALEALGIPYTGCGVAASAIGMDKFRCRLIWAGFGLPNVPFRVLTDETDWGMVESELGLPLFIKPAGEGSSVGVTRITESGRLKDAYEHLKAQKLHGEILAETAITGGEYTCAILRGRALPVVRIVPEGGFYDYEAKYLSDSTQYFCPSGLPEKDENIMRHLAEAAFAAVGGRHWGRVDFLRGEDGAPYLLEINTAPGMTSHSLVPKAALEAGIDFDTLCDMILNDALA